MKQELGLVIPVYSTKGNSRLSYFKDCLGSVLAQNFDFLCVIVDDGSTDETPDYIRSIQDSRIQSVRIERTDKSRLTSSVAANMGLNHLMNRGCSHFAYIHSDDIITPCSLERRVTALKEGAEMVYGRLAVYQDGNITLNGLNKEKQNHSLDVMGMGFPHHTSMWSRRMMELMMNGRANSVFDTRLDCVEDLDVTLYSRKIIETQGFPLEFVDGVLYIWVRSKCNITELVREKTVREQIEFVFKENGFDAPDCLRESVLKKWLTRPGYWLPERVKERLRPIKYKVGRITRGKLYPEPKEKTIQVDIDPLWFKN